MTEGSGQDLRVLVVDDSAYNRQTISSMLEARPGVKVVGRAVNGKEALKLVFDLEPDAITLDLEMPEMDGFSFLRLLMSKRPTPVLVISGYSQRENVFRALELGAMDFIAKPARHISPDIHEIADELSEKIAMVRRLAAVRLKQRADSLAASAATQAPAPGRDPAAPIPTIPARGVVGIAASTGGPPAIQQLLTTIRQPLNVAIVIAQHMPPRFTRAFAQRLDRTAPMRVVEIEDLMPVCAGVAYVAPGQTNVRLVADGRSPVVMKLVEPDPQRGGAPQITPSADRMLASVAETFGGRSLAVVLTGMGSDGARGVLDVRRAGGRVLVEDPSTAVMPGMPQSAIAAGPVDRVASIEELAGEIERFSATLGPDGR